MNAFQTDGQTFPTQSPSEPYEIYLYTSQPGDVLFFDENWVFLSCGLFAQNS